MSAIIEPVLELLAKYVHGPPKSANETFLHCIWACCPNERIRLAFSVATIIFDDGEIEVLHWFDFIVLDAGVNHVPYICPLFYTYQSLKKRASNFIPKPSL